MVITDVFVELIDMIRTYTFDTYVVFTESARPFLIAFTTLYIMLMGLAITYGKVKAKDFAMSMLALMLAAGIAFNPDTYTSYITDLLSDTTINTASYFASKGKSSGIYGVFEQVNTTFDMITSYSEKMEPTGNFITNSWLYIKAGTAIGLLGLFYLATIICFVGLFVMAWFSMHVLFVVGGVIVFLSGFDKTRFIFYAWLRSIFNHALIIVFASISISISLWLLEKSLTALEQTDITQGVFTPQYFAALIMSVLSVFLLLKCPDLASGLTGGFAGRTSTLAAFMSGAGSMGAGQMISPMQGAAGQAGRAGAGAGLRVLNALGSGAGRAYSALKGIK